MTGQHCGEQRWFRDGCGDATEALDKLIEAGKEATDLKTVGGTMSFTTIPFDMIRRCEKIRWPDLLWAFENGYIVVRDFVKFAGYTLNSKSDDLQMTLTNFGDGDMYEAEAIARRLASLDASEPLKEIWLFLILKWLYEHPTEFENPLEEVEKIYADFDYPVSIEEFVRYMPAVGDYDPAAHDANQNQRRLYSKWNEYLERESVKYEDSPDII